MVRKSEGSQRAARKLSAQIKEASKKMPKRTGVRLPRDEQLRQYIFNERAYMRDLVDDASWRSYERDMQEKLRKAMKLRELTGRG